MDPIAALLDAAILAAERGDHSTLDRIEQTLDDPAETARIHHEAAKLAAMEEPPQADSFRR